MPAIDEADDLGAPVPVSARVYLCVHGVLDCVEVVGLVDEGLVVDAADVWVERAQQDGYIWSHGVDCTLAKIIESGEVCGWDVDGEGVELHLFVAALHDVGPTLGSVVEPVGLKEGGSIWDLADDEQDVDAECMIVQNKIFECAPTDVACLAAAWITEA